MLRHPAAAQPYLAQARRRSLTRIWLERFFVVIFVMAFVACLFFEMKLARKLALV